MTDILSVFNPVIYANAATAYVYTEIQSVWFLLIGFFVGCGLNSRSMSPIPLLAICAATLIELSDNEQVRGVVARAKSALRSLNSKGRFDAIEDRIEQCKAFCLTVLVYALVANERNSATLSSNERRALAYKNIVMFAEGLVVWLAYDVSAFWLWQLSARLTMAIVCILIDLILVNDIREMRVRPFVILVFVILM